MIKVRDLVEQERNLVIDILSRNGGKINFIPEETLNMIKKIPEGFSVEDFYKKSLCYFDLPHVSVNSGSTVVLLSAELTNGDGFIFTGYDISAMPDETSEYDIFDIDFCTEFFVYEFIIDNFNN